MEGNLIVMVAAAALIASGCGNKCSQAPDWVKNGIETASEQLKLAATANKGTGLVPHSLYVGYGKAELCRQLGRDSSTFTNLKKIPGADMLGKVKSVDVYGWTSGFFSGTMWYLYELTGDETLKEEAIEYTNMLNPLRYYKGTHDLGFMVGCSYGNAIRLSPCDTIKTVMTETADNLIGRFDPQIGCIRSWDLGSWNYPVIIDNMMNLDLLFRVSDLTGDPKYRNVAVTHANTTLRNHFRDDYTSYHVVSYNSDGTVECKQTYQGRSDDSAWARGQSWALYGYTNCFIHTQDSTYLDIAQKIAAMVMSKVTTEDAIPYWDYNAPAFPDTPRDASAAAITASAMLDMSTLVPSGGQKYFGYAEKILRNLSSPTYLAKVGENGNFVLMHSVGSLPHGSEIDTPLNYADYYYIEALKKYLDLTESGCPCLKQ